MRKFAKVVFVTSAMVGAALMSGCGTPGQTVDYASLVQSTCKLASAEIGFLQTQSTMPESDVAALQKISGVVTPTCAAVSSNPQDTYGILTTVMISLTALYLQYHVGAAAPATALPASGPV
jgi:hypothetical protein